MKIMALVTLMLCVGLCACTRADSPKNETVRAAAVARHFEVRMLGGNSYDQPTIEIRVGDTITWINDDENNIHTATSDASDDAGPIFDTKNVQPLTYSKRIDKFKAAGTFDYHCGKHASMKAKVIVSP